MELPTLGVSEFVQLVNTHFDVTMPEVLVEGEIGEYKGANRNGHHYFSLKDDRSDIRCVVFANRSIPFVIEDGMKVIARAKPNLHNKYGFSLIVSNLRPSGEGELKKAYELTKKKLEAEGLFAAENKRPLPEYPQVIGLVTSDSAAAFTDVLDILDSRWPLAKVIHAQTGVQGESAPAEIVNALDRVNEQPLDVVLLVRGGGSAEDLSAFSAEEVVRAVSRSKAPIVVGVGHERDISLADLAADLRANTPTDAAQKSTPDVIQIRQDIYSAERNIVSIFEQAVERIELFIGSAIDKLTNKFNDYSNQLVLTSKRLEAYNPEAALAKGYSIIKLQNKIISSVKTVNKGDIINVKLSDGELTAEVEDVKR